MAWNPISFTQKVVADFLKYQLTAYPLADTVLSQEMRTLLSLEETSKTPLFKGPYISLSRSFLPGATIDELVQQGVFHGHLKHLASFPQLYKHQEKAVRAIAKKNSVIVSTGTGSGKTESFLYPIISRALQLRDEGQDNGILAVLVYPMNSLAEDQLGRLRTLLVGSGITFGMYVGKTPHRKSDVSGRRLPKNTSREKYKKLYEKSLKEKTKIYPHEERPSREELRKSPPRILITNVKQLELLLTRREDIEMFENANLEFIVFDEAHTFSGMIGAETACLIRRLRSFCNKSADEVTCIATSATIANKDDSDVGQKFASRFFGISPEKVVVVGEEYQENQIKKARQTPKILEEEQNELLRRTLEALEQDDKGEVCVKKVVELFEEIWGITLNDKKWQEELYQHLSVNAIVVKLLDILQTPRSLSDVCQELTEDVNRTVKEEEILMWLALGASAKKDSSYLLRPVIHGFICGVRGAVVTFPEKDDVRLWLSAEESTEGELIKIPLTTCMTCGQHYFVHHLEDYDFFEKEPGGGQASGVQTFWKTDNTTGKRMFLVDRFISHQEEEDSKNIYSVFLCRNCGTVHKNKFSNCCGCGRKDTPVKLMAIKQKQEEPGKITKCLTCGATGRRRGGTYYEPVRQVRAIAVSDVHVLTQNMLQSSQRQRLLVFADNRQDAAFQAGWMKDHARRYRLRALIMNTLSEGNISIGDLTSYLDQLLDQDDDLSKMLIPEVWRAHRKEATGRKHQDDRNSFLRILILLELTTRLKQHIGLEPWGRMRVEYQGLNSNLDFFSKWAKKLNLEKEILCEGVAALLDIIRRQQYVLDRENSIFSKFWMDGDREIQYGYLPKLAGVPRGLKLTLDEEDNKNRISVWITDHNRNLICQIARSWNVQKDDLHNFLRDLWELLTTECKLFVPVTLMGSKGKALASCSGVHQLDADRITLCSNKDNGIWRCPLCRRAQIRKTPNQACMTWRCDGQLQHETEDKNNYNLTLLDENFVLLNPYEHSAQVPANKRVDLERSFKSKSGAVNTLVCTPTLELGVDIGGLDCVLMRNVPPTPANYWQRAGRAGRRHRMAVNITYARSASHDQSYFKDPLKMLAGTIYPPSFNLRNEVMVRKHVHAKMITTLYQLSKNEELSAFDREEIQETLNRVFPRIIREYLFEKSGKIRLQVLDVSSLNTVVTKHKQCILKKLQEVFSEYWPSQDNFVVKAEKLESMILEATNELAKVVKKLKKRLDWAMTQQQQLSEKKQSHGTLAPDEEALERRCNRLVKRLKGVTYRKKQEGEGYDDINTYGVLSVEGFFPGYGLETGSVQAIAQLPRKFSSEKDYYLPRPPATALREYVPGNLIYANGHKFTPRFYHLGANEGHDAPLFFSVDIESQIVIEEGSYQDGAKINNRQIQAIPICDVDLQHQSHITDEEEMRFQLPVAVWGYELSRHGEGEFYHWDEKQITHRKSVYLRLVNVGAFSNVKQGLLGYPICTVCGQSRSPFSSSREQENFKKDHYDRCGKTVKSTGFYADVVVDAFTLLDCKNRSEALSIIEAVRLGAAQVLEMEIEDLQILSLSKNEATVDILLYDPMPGGSGLLQQMCERWEEVIQAATSICKDCSSQCEKSCIDCLHTFRNAYNHRFLDRHVALAKLEEWGQKLKFSHEIPQNLPAGMETKTTDPANQTEAKFLDMLQRAGLPKPIVGRSIPLPPPFNSTTPDCFYEGNQLYEGICIYIDGLSTQIHGNAKAFKRDRQIREQLRSFEYEVIEIAASDLDDKDAMIRYLRKLARILIGKDQAAKVKQDTSWFDQLLYYF